MLHHRSLWLTIGLFLLASVAFAQVGRIEGVVYLPGDNGGPAAGATVTFYHERTDSLVTTADGDGHFRLEDVPVGGYSAVASLEGYMPGMGQAFVTENHTTNVTLRLHPLPTGLGNVEGTVRLPGEHGGPAAGAVVTLRQMHQDSLTTTADAEGHFSFTAVAVGEYSARATLEGYLAAEAPVWVVDGQTSRLTLVLRQQATSGGAVEGLVLLADQTPAREAIVELAGNGEHSFYRGQTNGEGHFSIQHVAAGGYSITAMLPMHGFASDVIEVMNNQTTHVTLTLSDSSNGGGHHNGDSLTIVDLVGTAIVVRPDSTHRPHRVLYYLDVDNDGAPDYRLAFGPPWYNPPNVPPRGAERPANGDQITIHGGLLTYTDPPVVVVYDINGLFWRSPGRGHGGHGGGDHGHEGCNPDSVTRVEESGTAMVMSGGGYHGERVMYGLNTDNDMMPEFMLDFGRPDYDPGNGATRPSNGDTLAIVGGQIYCPNAETPVLVVYEINGLFWREPGDTTGLGAVDGVMEAGPVKVGTPVSYLTARNYPNPFNPTTVINYSLPMAGEVKLAVYDITGRKVEDLVHRYQEAGNYVIGFDGHALPSGIYFYRVSVGNLSFTNRMVLLK
ncbi:MAG TPA: carboxypeptidase regulatory-like domain-containing protein [bacterium]|jgi:hypothetical protein